MLFLGQPVEYWMRVRDFYEDIYPITKTESGKRLLLLGKIELLQQSIDRDITELKSLQNQLLE